MAKTETKKAEDNLQEVKNIEEQKSNDSDMPQPMTNTYKTTFSLTPMFMNLFNTCVGNMPYSSILTNPTGEKIKLIDVVKFVESKQTGITIDELNVVLGFLSSAPFKLIRPLMEMVENQEQQQHLWKEV